MKTPWLSDDANPAIWINKNQICCHCAPVNTLSARQGMVMSHRVLFLHSSTPSHHPTPCHCPDLHISRIITPILHQFAHHSSAIHPPSYHWLKPLGFKITIGKLECCSFLWYQRRRLNQIQGKLHQRSLRVDLQIANTLSAYDIMLMGSGVVYWFAE